MQEPQQGSQRGHHPAHRPWPQGTPGHHERAHHTRIQMLQVQLPVSLGTLGQEQASQSHIQLGCGGRQAPFRDQIIPKPDQQPLHWRRRGWRLRTREHSQPPQIVQQRLHRPACQRVGIASRTALGEVRVSRHRRQRGHRQVFSDHPAAQVRYQPHMRSR